MDERQNSLDEYSAKWWIEELKTTAKLTKDKWWTGADRVVKRYLDDREGDQGGDDNDKRYNVFWANVQILKSAMYAMPPKPAVRRQWEDPNDDVARCAALILERMILSGITKDKSDAHAAFQDVTEDRLIPGLGQVWHRYEPRFEEIAIPAEVDATGAQISPARMGQRIVDEKVATEYVAWRDFLWQPARRWSEVGWVARLVWLPKYKFLTFFSKEATGRDPQIVYKDIEERAKAEGVGEDEVLPKGFKKGKVCVWEIWCKDTNKVHWVSLYFDEFLMEKGDPLRLDDFFPCPKPLMSTHTTNELMPRPDYVMAQDQYSELDVLNARIYALTKALRVVGCYDKDNTELAKMITGKELMMIPVENWAMLQEGGGVTKAVEWFPVEQVANVLKICVEMRGAAIQQIYELTSISDIVRGVSQPRETAKAQTLKAQFSSVRLQMTQAEVARFVESSCHIKAEIICKHFQPATITKQSNIAMTDSAKFAPQAIELMKKWDNATYRIEIGEETLSMADYNAERELRIELMTAVGQMLSQSAALVESIPAALPYVIKIILWVISSFRGSADIETALDEAAEAAVGLPSTPPQEPVPQEPDPAMVAQADAQKQIAIDNNKHVQNKEMEVLKGKVKLLTEPRQMPTGEGDANV